VFIISLSIPNFTEDPLGIVIKSVGKENFHSSHIVLRATKMLSQESSFWGGVFFCE
jgi:hypothetical protein